MQSGPIPDPSPPLVPNNEVLESCRLPTYRHIRHTFVQSGPIPNLSPPLVPNNEVLESCRLPTYRHIRHTFVQSVSIPNLSPPLVPNNEVLESCRLRLVAGPIFFCSMHQVSFGLPGSWLGLIASRQCSKRFLAHFIWMLCFAHVLLMFRCSPAQDGGWIPTAALRSAIDNLMAQDPTSICTLIKNFQDMWLVYFQSPTSIVTPHTWPHCLHKKDENPEAHPNTQCGASQMDCEILMCFRVLPCASMCFPCFARNEVEIEAISVMGGRQDTFGQGVRPRWSPQTGSLWISAKIS